MYAKAGAEILVAALDCDSIALQVGRQTKGCTPVNLSVAAQRRGRNHDSAADRAAEAIRRGVRP
jgi:hypothetical protein